MVRKVENPFKEQGIPSWIRYLVTGLTGFFVAYYLFAGNGGSSEENELSFRQESNPRLRPGQQEVGVDDIVAEHQNDDFVEPEEDSESGDEMDPFPSLDQGDFLDWIRNYYNELKFESKPKQDKLNKPMLMESLQRGCDFMVANQKDAGNFNYQYDFVTKKMDEDDSPVRQAGALWGITLCFNHMPGNPMYRSTVERGIAFFRDHMVDGPVEGSNMLKYPGYDESPSGANALYGLALIDYIRTIEDQKLPGCNDHEYCDDIQKVKENLAKTIKFLRYMQNDNLHFSKEYWFEDEEKSNESSPYYDGEILLCLIRAAKNMEGYFELLEIIMEAAPVLAKTYTLDAWRTDEHDSDQTKGFYQWASMAYTEYYFDALENFEDFGDLVLALAHWIIHTHGILDRNRNTGYAFEGILSAYRIAQARNNTDALSELSYVVHEGLYKLGR